MVGHLHLQAMEGNLQGQSREALLDSPDSGLPPSPSPSPPFYASEPPGPSEAGAVRTGSGLRAPGGQGCARARGRPLTPGRGLLSSGFPMHSPRESGAGCPLGEPGTPPASPACCLPAPSRCQHENFFRFLFFFFF